MDVLFSVSKHVCPDDVNLISLSLSPLSPRLPLLSLLSLLSLSLFSLFSSPLFLSPSPSLQIPESLD